MVNWNKSFGWKYYEFSLGELKDLLITTLILGFLFSATHRYFVYTAPISVLTNFIAASIIFSFVIAGYIIGTKFFAERYNCRAEFVLWPIGAIFSIVVTMLTQFVFAVVGSIQITTKHSVRLGYRFIGLTNEELGKISLGGPLINLILAVFGFVFSPLSPGFFNVFIKMNLIFALFNMVPIPQMNGSKVFGWNRMVWGSFTAVLLVLLFLPDIIGTFFSILIGFLAVVLVFLIGRIVAPWTPPKQVHKF